MLNSISNFAFAISSPFIKRRAFSFLLILSILLFTTILFRTAWICDDAYITFRVVDNFVKGYGLKWNIDERVQVYTNPLWMFLVSGLYWLTRNLYFTVIIFSIFISLASVILLLNKIAVDNKAKVLSLLLLLSSKAYIDYSTSGLENPLIHLLASFFLVIFLVKDFAGRNIFYLSLIAALSAFNRMDTILFYIPPLFYLLIKIKEKKVIGPMLMGFVPFFMWEIFALIYYGFPFPNSFYSKLFNVGLSQIELAQQGIFYLINSLNMDPLTLLTIFLGFIIVVLRRDGRLVAISTGVALYLIYILKIGGDFMSGRFLAAPFFISVAIIMRTKINNKLIILSVFIIIFFNIFNPYAPIKSGMDYQKKEFDKHGIADERGYYFQDTGLIRRNGKLTQPNLNKEYAIEAQRKGGVTVFNAIGYFGFFCGPKVHVVDIYGIGDPFLARLPLNLNSREDWRIGHFERSIPSGYLETLAQKEILLKDDYLRDYYRRLNLIIRGPIWDINRFKEIINMNLGRYDFLLNSVLPDIINFGSTVSGIKTRNQLVLTTIKDSWIKPKEKQKLIFYKDADWFKVKPGSQKGLLTLEVGLREKKLKPGVYKGRIVIHAPSLNNWKKIISVRLKVYGEKENKPPIGWMDKPEEGEKIKDSGCFVAGWALDDIEIEEVQIKREPLEGKGLEVLDSDGLIFLGRAGFRAWGRPDIYKLYPQMPLNYRTSWGFDLKPEHFGFKKNISLKLYAIFLDKDGFRTVIGPRKIFVE